MWKQSLAISATVLMLAASAADENWRLHGAQNSQRFSRLNQIDERTVSGNARPHLEQGNRHQPRR